MSETLWNNANVLITGVCGTVGRALLAQVLEKGPRRVVGLDNNESATYFLAQDCRDQPVKLFVGDVRDRDAVTRLSRGIDVILHAAGLKHVMMCEDSPRDAVQTNVLGTQNVIDAVLQNNVARFIFTSTDKAVNPTSVMGTSKLMAERLVTAESSHEGLSDSRLATTRFGNILGSEGSAIPVFRRQIRRGGPVTLTDPGMTRFIMSLDEAAKLVMSSAESMVGGEVFVTKMRTLRIPDLVQVMIEELAPRYGHRTEQIEVQVVGSRPGEKLHEELLSQEEGRRSFATESFYIILPALHRESDAYRAHHRFSADQPASYASDEGPFMTPDDIRVFLTENHLLDDEEGR